MPIIKLIKKYTRNDKVFEIGDKIPVSSDGYKKMLEEGYCNKLKENKVKNEKKTKIENIKDKE
tara:strand:- start:590 stop:778 length:189 start_codon:yes stop_codon:yes gene_type:complete